jgi:hypothetical protein
MYIDTLPDREPHIIHHNQHTDCFISTNLPISAAMLRPIFNAITLLSLATTTLAIPIFSDPPPPMPPTKKGKDNSQTPLTQYIQCPQSTVEVHGSIEGCVFIAVCCDALYGTGPLDHTIANELGLGAGMRGWEAGTIGCRSNNKGEVVRIADNDRQCLKGGQVYLEHPRACLVPKDTREYKEFHKEANC